MEMEMSDDESSGARWTSGAALDLALLDLTFGLSPQPLLPSLNPAMMETDPQALTDLILVSADAVCFIALAATLLASSNNNFHDLLSSTNPAEYGPTGDKVIWLSEPSMVVTIVLHAIYDVSCGHLSPSLSHLVAAVDALEKYGMHIRTFLSLGTPLFEIMKTHALCDAVALYVLASHHDLYDLAAYASSHLLSLDVRSLPNDVVDQMHPVYFKHLVSLHVDRVAAFKRLLVASPDHHPPTDNCTASQQMERLTRTWALVTCFLSFSAKADLSQGTIMSTFHGVGSQVPCDLCRRALATRLQKVKDDWSAVKVRMFSRVDVVLLQQCEMPKKREVYGHGGFCIPQ